MNTLHKTILLFRTGRAYNKVIEAHNNAVRKISDIDENRRSLRVQIDNLQEENYRLKRARKTDATEISDLSSENTARQISIDNGLKREAKIAKDLSDAKAVIAELKDALKQSTKNDTAKDPKTGKFVSKKKAPAKKKAAKKSAKKR